MLNRSHSKCSGALRALAVAGALIAPSISLAEEVVLRSPDGKVDLTGELLSFENNTYIVETLLGELRLRADQVDCIGGACPSLNPVVLPKADIVIAGSDTVGLGIMPLLIEGWAASQDAGATLTDTGTEGEIIAEVVGDSGFGDPVASVLVSSTTSGDAFTALQSREAAIGMASRPIKDTEASLLLAAGAGDMTTPENERIVAVDSLVPVVHPDNPVSAISVTQLADIYEGRVTNWSQLGGPDAAIKVYDRQESSGTRAVFMDSILGRTPVQAANMTIADDNVMMADAVAADPLAVGYVGYGFQRGTKALTLINECGIAVQPDAFSARTEEYTLQRRLYLYHRADDRSATSKAFLDYAQSLEADEVIEKAGFISLAVDMRAQDFGSLRAQALLKPAETPFVGSKMREMLGTMVNYDRLSPTFRFSTGSTQLDDRAALDMARLTAYLSEAPQGTRVMFVGFTDDVGTFENNQALSENRAAQVMQLVQAFAKGKLGGIEMESAGFGEIAPTACNTNDGGRTINRRVEVWITSPSSA